MDKMKLHSEAIAKFGTEFLPPNFEKRMFNTISNLLWQILINQVHKDQKFAFYVDVISDTGHNELILAFEEGGFIRTNVYFANDAYNHCSGVAQELSEFLFNYTLTEFEVIINNSMRLKK